jgi:hypothetical protein
MNRASLGRLANDRGEGLGGGVDSDTLIRGTRRHPVVAIRCGCSCGDEYGYAAGFVQNEASFTNTPIVPKSVQFRPAQIFLR